MDEAFRGRERGSAYGQSCGSRHSAKTAYLIAGAACRQPEFSYGSGDKWNVYIKLYFIIGDMFCRISAVLDHDTEKTGIAVGSLPCNGNADGRSPEDDFNGTAFCLGRTGTGRWRNRSSDNAFVCTSAYGGLSAAKA